MLLDVEFSNLKRRIKSTLKSIVFDMSDPGFQTGKKLFFVTGRPKSGTTWMGNLLNSHPCLFCDMYENAAFHSQFKALYFQDFPQLLQTNEEEFFHSRTSQLIKNGLIASLVGRCGNISAVKMGDKTPELDLNKIFEEFPLSQVIVMLRDFRDALVSSAFHVYRGNKSWHGVFEGSDLKAIDNTFLKDTLTKFEKQRDIATYLSFETTKPAQVKVIRYEDMLMTPETTLTSIYRWLGVNSSSQIVSKSLKLNSFEALSKGRLPGQEDKASFFRKGITGDWQNHFSDQNKMIFKEISGKTLVKAGYESDDRW